MGGYRHLLSVVIRQTKREEFGLGISDFVVISIGELNDNKNHQVIIKAIANIPDIKYMIVGKGMLAGKLMSLAEDIGVSDRLILTGYRTDIKELLWAADCFALPSKREGLGLAALEGMASGLPVIGNSVGGIRDFVINGETGWLSASDDDYKNALINARTHYMNKKKLLSITSGFDIKFTNEIMKKVYMS